MTANHQVFCRAILRVCAQGVRLLAATAMVAGCTPSTEPSQQDLFTLEAVTPTNLAGVVATDISTPPTLRVRDQNGKPIAGIVVSFHATGTGTIVNTSARTDATGIAGVGRWIMGEDAGKRTLTAASVGLIDVVFTAVAEPGPAARIVQLGGNRQVGDLGAVLDRLSVKV